jgi:hypothetical protein
MNAADFILKAKGECPICDEDVGFLHSTLSWAERIKSIYGEISRVVIFCETLNEEALSYPIAGMRVYFRGLSTISQKDGSGGSTTTYFEYNVLSRCKNIKKIKGKNDEIFALVMDENKCSWRVM